ncbi:hypothetical protein DOS84_05080 [Flavobacterium aquariorum]|uniref:Uncharacterized protein n=1 Tax=Flavobacterium aquariorum TaxID=2217670 RepID=A0A2W7TZN4_9FLAO|nr:hypothetical protein [Flavobacterium aquariorum]PZX94924.1 hypothetical protein DOS84_05080 [Flavobacterium aquariorum]
MNNDKKNNQANKKKDNLQEPEIVYGIGDNSVLNNIQRVNPILEKLILKSIQDSTKGKGISHGEMMQKVKLKYPFLK